MSIVIMKTPKRVITKIENIINTVDCFMKTKNLKCLENNADKAYTNKTTQNKCEVNNFARTKTKLNDFFDQTSYLKKCLKYTLQSTLSE